MPPARNGRRSATCTPRSWTKPAPSNSASQPIAGTLAADRRASQTKADLMRTLAELSKVGVSGPLGCYVGPDAKKSDQHILASVPGGPGPAGPRLLLGCQVQGEAGGLQAYIERMLTLAKIARRQAARPPRSWPWRRGLPRPSGPRWRTATSTRPTTRWTRAELAKLAPGFDWQLYFDDDRRQGRQGARRRAAVVSSRPMAELLDNVPLATWKAWLKWQRRPSLREPAEQGTGRRGLRLLRHDAPRRPAEPPPLEAGRRRRRRLPGRGGGQAVRREAFPAGSQAADGPDGQERPRGLSPGHSRTSTG